MDTQFLRFIADIWPDCTAALARNSDENLITRTIVDRVGRLSEARRCLRLEYHYEPFAHTNSGAAISKGQIDIAVFVTREREIYLAYECKRLNVIRPDGRRALATEYVAQGVMRFITEQYSENLPMGCMLGYVMDGDLKRAYDSIEAAIMAKEKALGFQKPLEMNSPVKFIQRFVTRHTINDQLFEMHHALLPFPEGGLQKC